MPGATPMSHTNRPPCWTARSWSIPGSSAVKARSATAHPRSSNPERIPWPMRPGSVHHHIGRVFVHHLMGGRSLNHRHVRSTCGQGGRTHVNRGPAMTVRRQRIRHPSTDQTSAKHEEAGHVPQMRSEPNEDIYLLRGTKIAPRA